MKIPCDIIKDLLPLYNDGVCSEESVNAVEEHLTDCPDCTEELEKLKEDSPAVVLKKEENDIIAAYRRKFFYQAMFFAFCLVIVPSINTFFIMRLSDFSPVRGFLISLLVMLSSVYLPTATKNNRKAVLINVSLITPVIVFILLSVDLFTDRHYMTENLPLFIIPPLIYLGFSIAFLPFKIRTDYKSPMLYKKTAFKIGIMETAILISLSLISAFTEIWREYTHTLDFTMLKYIIPQLIFMWGALLLFRFLKLEGLVKVSVFTAFIGFYLCCYPVVEYYLFYSYTNDYYCFWQANLLTFDPQHFIANMSLIILIISISISVILFVKGKFGDKKILETNSQTKE